jgi:hypothetical protein|tara:strand:- start:780 stop:968 length:189 start_codon:yes stop_codon:yes gene_type:complete
MKFDSNGIYASSEKLKEIALIVLEQEKRDREAARRAAESASDFPSWGPAMGQWGHWNISDRD